MDRKRGEEGNTLTVHTLDLYQNVIFRLRKYVRDREGEKTKSKSDGGGIQGGGSVGMGLVGGQLGLGGNMATLCWGYFTEDPLDEALNKEFDRSKLSIKMSYTAILVFMHCRTIVR